MVQILLIAEEYPDEIADGLSEIAQHYIHQNFKLKDSMISEEYEYKWRLKFIQDNDLESGKLIVSSNLTNFREIPPDVEMEITIIFNKKIEGN